MTARRKRIICPTCGRLAPRKGEHDGHDHWLTAWGHRCPHGEPCRGNGKASGIGCAECLARDLTVVTLPDAVDETIRKANVEKLRETGIGPELPPELRWYHLVPGPTQQPGNQVSPYRSRKERWGTW